MGRPRTPLLSPERITQAALEIVREQGDFTVAGLAAHLGVRVSSLYNHVRSKSEIIQAIRRDRLLPALERLRDEPDPRRLLELLVLDYYDFLSRVPQLVPLLVSEPIRQPEMIAYYDLIARSIARMGVPEDEVMPALGLLEGYVLGAAVDLGSKPFDPRDTGGAPHLGAALSHRDADDPRRLRSFEAGLAIALRGLAAGVP
ncbi:TetR/AcrR family transcriptional regulator [Nocardiopsis changdeensis]|uniref:TetR/AcrR family transcriptional regulator n=1 Tax=Nocardiopsis changdeensis TaxID=2831969 RepID=A0ABX8BPI8_9ACTN|nr:MULTISPECIES: TetR/AcrR family transcriptional regulator [Nocardiopsis]QUX23994.1 TetR/AcrR family transcriptional regulator [Nocardiopsis changdeensis]QYX34389.1 TetR/AcrR family transcriptional regulator [Nocardiopsis sp. MT53]